MVWRRLARRHSLEISPRNSPSGHSRGRSAATGDARIKHDQKSLRASQKGVGNDWEQWQEMLASRTHPRRLMTLLEMSNVAASMPSDKASGMTGTTVNLSMGSL